MADLNRFIPVQHDAAAPGGSATWAKVPAELVALVEAANDVRRMSRSAWLFHEGEAVDCLFALMTGAITIRRSTPCGEDFAVYLATPGMTIGYRGLIMGGRHPVSARCSTDCVVCRLPRAAAEAAMQANRALEGIFFRHMALELGCAETRMLHNATLCVRDRMLMFLGELTRHFGRTVGGGALHIAIPISRIDMGSLTGMTSETVSRCIRNLQAENLAHFTRRQVVIPSRERFLAELALLQGQDGRLHGH
ncbi:MAG: Crp/Fnr family transcriptional regulator [Magnetospirillum sp.]|nr:Crp/Fnr family transcriptional regulator [Magnetospirillum sp.]